MHRATRFFRVHRGLRSRDLELVGSDRIRSKMSVITVHSIHRILLWETVLIGLCMCVLIVYF
jgi:hypothetical protein